MQFRYFRLQFINNVNISDNLYHLMVYTSWYYISNKDEDLNRYVWKISFLLTSQPLSDQTEYHNVFVATFFMRNFN